MKIPIDGIQAFVQIARLGSFHRAAEHLSLTQTAMSRRIQRLEAFVGVKLLDRTTRSTALAPVGREFLPLAMRLVEDLTYGLERLRTNARLSLGDVTVATIQSVAFRQLPIALSAYSRLYPHNRVQLLERSGSLVTEAVRQEQADFGIHIHQDGLADLTQDVLMRDPFVLVCSNDHALSSVGEVRWSELGGLDLITLGGASGNRRIVEERLITAGLEGRGRFVVESTPTAIALARANVGAAILPAAMRASVVATGLVEIAIIDPVVYRSISLVRRQGVSLTPAAVAFYELLRRHFGTTVEG
jgi:DNA-binding transcriptional LysR family regulator